jgi:colicin import membrane protein
MSIPKGYGVIAGRSKATAEKLLAFAREQGLDVAVVKSTRDGYQVPQSIIDSVDAENAREREAEIAQREDAQRAANEAEEQKQAEAAAAAEAEAEAERVKTEAREAETAKAKSDADAKAKADAKAETAKTPAKKTATR